MPPHSRRPLRSLRLPALLFVVLCSSFPARADNPLLDRNGNPNALFWTAGAATVALDQPLYDLARRLDSPATHRAAIAFNNLGDARVQLTALAVMALAGGKADRIIARRGLHGLVAGGLLVTALKNATRKSRPWTGRGPDYGVRPEGKVAQEEGASAGGEPGEVARHIDANQSFPSGHTMAAFSLATVLAKERPRDRELVYALAALVGLSRIQLKQHWPSDVFFGAAVGIAAGNAANRDVPFGLMFRVR